MNYKFKFRTNIKCKIGQTLLAYRSNRVTKPHWNWTVKLNIPTGTEEILPEQSIVLYKFHKLQHHLVIRPKYYIKIKSHKINYNHERS